MTTPKKPSDWIDEKAKEFRTVDRSLGWDESYFIAILDYLDEQHANKYCTCDGVNSFCNKCR